MATFVGVWGCPGWAGTAALAAGVGGFLLAQLTVGGNADPS